MKDDKPEEHIIVYLAKGLLLGIVWLIALGVIVLMAVAFGGMVMWY